MSETGQRCDAFLGWHLQLGGDMLILDWDELYAREPGAKSGVKEVRVQNIVFPLRAARLEAKQHLLMDKADDGCVDDLINDPDLAEDVHPADDAGYEAYDEGHVRYDVLRGFAKLFAVLAIIVFALVAENPSAL
eukprot:3831525-Heterocapsa_arctica.AAC.1